ncbi:hypothetical protein QFC19_004110 [Naganishia cerealis]|uniref:Uncharacterized protein n=1 Tax=Naganishia cerealis TaxID=610337 RepID=A0ACC2VZS1_9TREE|nr:hypothetical protein QFC19_004110 [Naganishia cerealis]
MSSEIEGTTPAAVEQANQPVAASNVEEGLDVKANDQPASDKVEPTASLTASQDSVAHNDILAQEQQETATQEQQAAPTISANQAQPKLNPGASEFISRSSSTGPGADAGPPPVLSSHSGQNSRTDGKPNALSHSRHAGPRGAPIRPGRQSIPNNRPSHDQPENPVELANPVDAGNVVNAAGMMGFRPPRASREPRPPRGYIPPAPERKARLTADELEEKMAKMRLLNERTQAEQEARNADAQAYERQVSAEKERIAKERERRKAEEEAKSKRTLAVQANIDQQREQFRQRKLKLLESQGEQPRADTDEGDEERSDSYRSFGTNRAQERGGAGEYGGYGYRGGRGGSHGGGGGHGYGNQGEGWQEGRRTQEHGHYSAGSGREDFRGRGRGRGAARGARQNTGDLPRSTGQNPKTAKQAQTSVIPDTKDETSFPALGDRQKESGVGSQQQTSQTKGDQE